MKACTLWNSMGLTDCKQISSSAILLVDISLNTLSYKLSNEKIKLLFLWGEDEA